MSSKDKVLNHLKIIGSALILYSIIVGIYFKIIYEPFEKVANPESLKRIDELNRSLVDSHNRSIFAFLVFTLMICYLISYYMKIEITPITEVQAKLILKEEGIVVRGRSGAGCIGILKVYKLTFQLENGEKIGMNVSDSDYMTVLEGNKGIMRYKKGVVNTFEGFYVTEIE